MYKGGFYPSIVITLSNVFLELLTWYDTIKFHSHCPSNREVTQGGGWTQKLDLFRVKACSHDVILLYYYAEIKENAEIKEIINELVTLSLVVYEPKQNSSCLHVKIIQTLARSFIKFIH